MLKNTNSFAKILMTGAVRGPSKHITPPLSYLYNSITYRHINANRTQAGVWACAQNDHRDARIRFVRKLYAIKKWTQGVLTRFIPVSFIFLETFFPTRNADLGSPFGRTLDAYLSQGALPFGKG